MKLVTELSETSDLTQKAIMMFLYVTARFNSGKYAKSHLHKDKTWKELFEEYIKLRSEFFADWEERGLKYGFGGHHFWVKDFTDARVLFIYEQTL